MVFMPMIIQKLDFYGNARLDKFLSPVLLFNLKCDIVGLGVASAPANMVRFCVGSAPMAFTRFFHFFTYDRIHRNRSCARVRPYQHVPTFFRCSRKA